jgi:hypothetical protein
MGTQMAMNLKTASVQVPDEHLIQQDVAASSR